LGSSVQKLDAVLHNAGIAGREWIVWRVTGKKQCFEFDDADPVAQLVALTNQDLSYEANRDLVYDHYGNVDETFTEWRTLESLHHTRGADSAAEGNSYRTVRPGPTLCADGAWLSEVNEILNEFGYFDARTGVQPLVQPDNTIVSTRIHMTTTVRTQKGAVRGAQEAIPTTG